MPVAVQAQPNTGCAADPGAFWHPANIYGGCQTGWKWLGFPYPSSQLLHAAVSNAHMRASFAQKMCPNMICVADGRVLSAVRFLNASHDPISKVTLGVHDSFLAQT